MADEGGYEEEEIITVTKLKLKSGEHIYVKIRWLQDESLHITALNGLLAWSYHMSVQDVAEIALAWGISVGEFMEMAALHLCFQDPTATYSFRALDFNWTWALFSWTMAGRKVKLELKKEHDPAAIICNVFDHILGKIERLKAEQAEAEVSIAHLPSRHNHDALQKQNVLHNRSFTESQYTLTHFGPQNSQFGAESKASKPPRNPQKTFELSSSKTAISHVDHEISQLETISVCGPWQASCNSMKDSSLINPSAFSLLGSQRLHFIGPPDTGMQCNKRPYSHCFQTTNSNQELTFNCNKRRGAIMEERAQVCEQQCEGAPVVLDNNIMRLLNCLTRLPAKVGAESVRCVDRFPANFKLPRAPVKDNEAHVVDKMETSDAKKTNVELKKGVLRAEAVSFVDELRGNVSNVGGFPHRVSHSNTKDDVIVVSDSDHEGQEDDRRFPLQSKDRDRRGLEMQGAKNTGESSGHRVGREEGNSANIGMLGKEDQSVVGNVPIERVVPTSGGIDNVGPWSERQPLVTLQKYEKKLVIPQFGEASKGAGAEEQNTDSSVKEEAFPSSFYTGFRGVRESTAGKWRTWLMEVKNEFQEGTSWECSGHRDTERPKEPDEMVKGASSGKGTVLMKADSFQTSPLLKVNENHKIFAKANVEVLDLLNDEAYPVAKVPSNRRVRPQHVNQRGLQNNRDSLGRWISKGTLKSNSVKVEPVAEFSTKGKLEGNKKGEKALLNQAENVSEDDTEEVPHLGRTSSQKCRKGMANMLKPSQRECNGSGEAQGVVQEHKKLGRPFSAAKQQKIAAQYTSPDAGAHTKVGARKLPSDSSDDDASIIEVKLDKTLHQEFQDADYYKFEDDRTEERIKKDQIWALYDEVDDMPRTWVRITKVSRRPPFRAWFKWLERINVSPQEHQWQQTHGYSLSCGEFKDGRDGRCNTISIFSHQMIVTGLSNRHVQIYPNKGEVWAFHRNRNRSTADKTSEKEGDRSEKPNGRDCAKEPGFRLVEIVSGCGPGRSPGVQALGKLPGFRTFWVPAYKKGLLPPKLMHYFSHRVPAYRMRGNEGMNIPTNCWDIDPAAIPKWESKMT
ncbi:hypothetical protein BDL97_02G072700 [Sphagnum fallax]|nr:hypothetical protein BDL97_02G072700 [Sphagnum fallax]